MTGGPECLPAGLMLHAEQGQALEPEHSRVGCSWGLQQRLEQLVAKVLGPSNSSFAATELQLSSLIPGTRPRGRSVGQKHTDCKSTQEGLPHFLTHKAQAVWSQLQSPELRSHGLRWISP